MADLDTLRPEVRMLSNDLLACADEVAEFPHPSHCDHLHDAAALMTDASAELLRLARDNVALRSKCNAIMSGSTRHLGRAARAEAELAALKARMKPCAQVRDGEVRALMDPDDEGKYVAVVVVEE